eukprot:TRINITY_DN10260_c0_g1_i5.p1 TRINITY_DN10260_c0_g1~~TRINITY_DN10260_c0_g1_i5.p1  ORF type:complete len:160 (+),score=23.61 TRINITY_DN10260_c0_g1_i5:165-644(+)
MICARDESQDTCKGDSGGPLILETIKDQSPHSLFQDLLVGLTSWGVERYCEGLGFPGVYTRISFYWQWIKNTMEMAYLNTNSMADGLGVATEQNKVSQNGQPPAICLEEVDVGFCDAAFERWYYNADERECQEFYYGGCLGNNNNFESVDECRQTCKLT